MNDARDTVQKSSLIPKHGGYRKLQSYRNAEIVYDGTVDFCKKHKSLLTYKTYEQMIGAARSGKQNIAEGSMVSGTSKKSEIKLVSIARGSLEELLQDYEDFLRQNEFNLWEKNDSRVTEIRQMGHIQDRSYTTYKSYINSANPELATNTLICLIHQTNYLLDRQLRSLEEAFLKHGGFTERMYRFRTGSKTGNKS